MTLPIVPPPPGSRFGRLTVLGSFIGKGKGGHRRLACQCDCGVRCEPIASHVLRGLTRSCGCLWAEVTAAGTNTTHGHARWRKETKEFKTWQWMLQRCYYPKSDKYAYYGGRGIKVCDRWRHDFATFLADMGPRPGPGYTIERNDNDRDYEPGNCRWATRGEQASNRRNNCRITIRGVTRTRAEWSRVSGIPYFTLRNRIRDGWDPERAISTPVSKGPRAE